MNSILQLKGRFESRPNTAKGGSPKLPINQSVSSNHLRKLASQLTDILEYWKNTPAIAGVLISVHYKRIVPKSGRLKILLSTNSKEPIESIRGAKFEWGYKEDGSYIPKHVFTHYVPFIAIERAIYLLNQSAEIIDIGYSKEINSEDTEKIIDKKYIHIKKCCQKQVF